MACSARDVLLYLTRLPAPFAVLCCAVLPCRLTSCLVTARARHPCWTLRASSLRELWKASCHVSLWSDHCDCACTLSAAAWHEHWSLTSTSAARSQLDVLLCGHAAVRCACVIEALRSKALNSEGLLLIQACQDV